MMHEEELSMQLSLQEHSLQSNCIRLQNVEQQHKNFINNSIQGNEHSSNDQTSITRQLFAALVVTLGSFSVGNALAWTSPALPKISQELCRNQNRNASNINSKCDIDGVTFELAGWIGPLLPAGAILVGPMIGFLVNKLGRKYSMVVLCIPNFVGWVLVTISRSKNSIIALYIGRILIGFGAGAFTLIAPMYISEIAQTSLRGGLASLMQLQSNIGVAFVTGLNIHHTFHWVSISWACMSVPVILAVGLFWLPESPYYLVEKNRIGEARESLRWLRGKNHDTRKELEEFQVSNSNKEEIGSISLIRLLTEGAYLKPFIISTILMFLQQFCGVNAVIFYAETIFIKAGSSVEPGLSAFLVAFCQVLGTGAAILLVDKYGRRILLVLSTTLMCFSIFSLGIYFFMDENKKVVCPVESARYNKTEASDACVENLNSDIEPELVKNLSWIPLLSLLVYIFFFSIGIGPLAWTLNAELFPPEAKTVASPITFCFNWLCAFVVTKYEPDLEGLIGASGAYFLFAGVCGAGTIFVYCVVPETKGKDCEEIRSLYAATETPCRSKEVFDFNNNPDGDCKRKTTDKPQFSNAPINIFC